jgi:hypothetical protein
MGIGRVVMIREAKAVPGFEPARRRLKAGFPTSDLDGVISLNRHEDHSFLQETEVPDCPLFLPPLFV